MVSRATLIVTLLFVVSVIGSCRCSQDSTDEEDSGGGISSSSEEEHGRVGDTAEKLIAQRREPEPAPPPRRPRERRRPSGQPQHPEPTEDDPIEGQFTLEQATEGLEGTGPLVAEILTDFGQMECTLHEEQVPLTVANFVGLARGTRPWWDPYAGEWVRRPFYNGLLFHRVIPGFMIQGGCPLGRGSGNPGYRFADEIDESLRHDRGGILSMANSGPNTNGSQFFVLDDASPHLNGRHTVFGVCEPTDVVYRIARVPQGGRNRPLTDVIIRAIRIRRGD